MTKANAAVSFIRQHLKAYVFRDVTVNPPHPFESSTYDILEALNTIENKVYSDAYSKFADITDALKKLKDPHTLFNTLTGETF
jgi:hypothetical protein